MAKPKSFNFMNAIKYLQATEAGKESTMYGHLRDVFVHTLGYAPGDVDIDTAGDDGRPDVTVKAPSGLVSSDGKPVKFPWIVVEAKDEKDAFSEPENLEEIFSEKAKYIGPHTGWFVMVDPVILIARRVGGKEAWVDTPIHLADIRDEAHFLSLFSALNVDLAGVSDQLARFRQGDADMIATEKLTKADPLKESKAKVARQRIIRKRFFSNLRDATQHLQDACGRALAAIRPKVMEFKALHQGFVDKFGSNGKVAFDPHTLMLAGSPQGFEDAKRHDKEALALKRKFAKEPHIARLAIEGLPSFQDRTGVDDDKLEDLFTVETANLILARILLLRFFEDHGFFGEQKYVCNGGIAAFQAMREYFKESYTTLLERAYRQGSRLFAAAFDETELDWVFGTNDPELSTAIEWSMFQFARYDFRTIQGDILTGIYDRFMDRAKRKELGEFFTPPSIARYILRRVGVQRGDRIFDAACGSGTFLIEAYRELVGEDVERGAAEYSDVLATLDKICGNDLNTFSSLLAQIQMLWQILSFRKEIEDQGFPDLPVASRFNSLVPAGLLSSLGRFSELDTQDYAAVVGNPPYVRPERGAQALDAESQRYYAQGCGPHKGVSPNLNAYALFIYRALHAWCRRGDGASIPPGRLGFIVQTSLFDANENAGLRALFKPGGRWRIVEILDLEIIYRQVFDADVLPVIIICENRPATAEDRLSIRIATKECVRPGEDEALPQFEFDTLPEESIPYADAFTPDGRILTRLTEKRLKVIRKLWANPTLESAAKKYWVRKDKSKIVEWRDTTPPQPELWEERRMIAGGIAFRGAHPKAKPGLGLDVYKGENIIATELQGDPVEQNCAVAEVDDPSLWKYQSLFPDKAYAVARVAHCPNAVEFDPKKSAFTNTATLLVPSDLASPVPIDLLLLSNIYVYFYALAARMGVLRLCRSDVYPTNLALLPWNEKLISIAAAIEGKRDALVAACRNASDAEAALFAALEGLALPSLKKRMSADKATRIAFGDNYSPTGYEAEVVAPKVSKRPDGMWRVQVSDDLFDWVDLTDESLAYGLKKALEARNGHSVGKSDILNLPIPVSTPEVEAWDHLLAKFAPAQLLLAREREVRELDKIIAPALGLDETDLEAIWDDCQADPFLKRIKPRYPGTVTRKAGFRKNLDSSDRYK